MSKSRQEGANHPETCAHLRDKLPNSLDWNSLEVVKSSHPIDMVRVSEDGELYVYYKNIELLDSNTNEAKSHGYFEFKITPIVDLKEGTRIENKAEISFDYEDPIFTNTVVNTIKYSNESKKFILNIYPNPAQDRIHLNISDYALSFDHVSELSSVQIISSNGSTIFSQEEVLSDKLEVDISGLIPGMYYVKGVDVHGNVHYGRFIK